MRDNYDIVVVGAGPAGSTTARYAAKGGCSVLMLEKDREIGIPVRCGEAVGEAGLKKVLEPRDNWIANRIEGVRLIAPDGTIVEVAHQEGGYILHRKIFDPDLASMAADEGVEIVTKAYVYDLLQENDAVTGVKVKYLNKEFQVRAKIVVGADGVESRVGRWAGLKTHVKLCDIETCAQMTITNINLDRRYCDFYFSSKLAPGGYVWVFPKDDHTANVGLGISGEFSAQKPAIEYLKEFINEKFPGASVLITVAGGVPCAPYLENIVKDGLMLVGDAAHQANPISGGGIIQSIMAGEIAGKVAAEAINQQDVSRKKLEEYPRQWYKIGGKTHIRSYRLKEAVYKLTDEELNKTAQKINKYPPEKRTIVSIFKVALLNYPRLIPDILKVFLS